MKVKLISVFVLLLFAIMGTGSVSFASSPGSKCVKVGRTVVSNGMTLRCVKTKTGRKWRRAVPATISTPTSSAVPTTPVVSAESTVLNTSGLVSVTSNVVGTVYLVEQSVQLAKISDVERLSTWWWMSAPISKVGVNLISVDVQTKLNGVYRVYVVDVGGVLSPPASQMVTISVAGRAQPVQRSCANQAAEVMCLVFDTRLDDSSSDLNTVTLPLGGTFDVTVDWGDGSSQRFTTGPVTRTYSAEGEYVVTIAGDAESFGGGGWAGESLLESVSSFGSLGLTSLADAFLGASNLTVVPAALPNTVTSTRGMFDGAIAFNQDISGWNTSNVTEMQFMFFGASSFNQSLAAWNVSNVTNMAYMFGEASSFNQSLAAWNVSRVTRMSYMFVSAISFNQSLAAWNVSRVTYMSSMFNGASSFNQSLDSWDVSSVTGMALMFRNASAFNQSLAAWNVSNVTNMESMFEGASSFNQSLAAWDVSRVTNMSLMFKNASAFNQSLAAWNVSNVTNMTSMLGNTSLSTANYDAMLNGWASSSVRPGVNFGVGNTRYSSAGAAARSTLTSSPKSWVITDGGLAP